MVNLRILVFGSRTWDDRETIRNAMILVLEELDCFANWSNFTIVHGAARGADTLAAEIASERGMNVEAHPADWTKHGKSAGHRRNAEMLATGIDFAIGFFDGWTPGSADMLKRCIEAGIPVRVIARKAGG